MGGGATHRATAPGMAKPPRPGPLISRKAPSAGIGPGDPIVRPSGYERVDYEAELALVIGRRAHRVAAAGALEVVLGYTCVNDVTVRDLQKRDVQFARARGLDTFCPPGPCIRAGLAPSALAVRARVNGELRQDSRTSDLIFSVPELIEFISGVMTLEPGDVISTGTPSGVGPLAPGDTVEVEVEGVGALVNPVTGD